jgi:hypothetical protein
LSRDSAPAFEELDETLLASFREAVRRFGQRDEAAGLVVVGPERTVFRIRLAPESDGDTPVFPGRLGGEMPVGTRDVHACILHSGIDEVVDVDKSVAMGTEQCTLGHAPDDLP